MRPRLNWLRNLFPPETGFAPDCNQRPEKKYANTELKPNIFLTSLMKSRILFANKYTFQYRLGCSFFISLPEFQIASTGSADSEKFIRI
jgi:hypothetical protein